ncbi:potassium channel family protein [Gaiella sp.]|uniref:potassium channel family protein n=1 Tax=Gaiella sp. TaxID=2663207 RepID=UPI002E34EEF6|nr:potassium channel family protein [Gaiella sp.]HEX5585335.1 potassium channel family protein [Gaiella sp.]
MRLLSDKNISRLNRAVLSGRIIPFLVGVMFLTAGIATGAVELFSPNSFSSVGSAAWWAAATVTTIGYGDVVPGTGGGRVIAVPVMFLSVATISFTTAVITAAFVGYQQRRLTGAEERHQALLDRLASIEQKLDALDQRR